MNENNHHIFHELVAAKLFGEISREEEKILDTMLQDESNRLEYQRLESLHRKLPGTQSLTKVSAERSWHRIERGVHRKNIIRMLEYAKYAAIVVFAVFAGTLLPLRDNGKNEILSTAEITVPPGQMSSVTLYDGTKVWLNSGTTLRYGSDFGVSSRQVILNGEAFFKVTKDKLPFRVRLKNSEVEVLGTQFNAISFAEEKFSQVTLVDGSVKMNTLSGKEIAVMKPSDQMTLSDDLKEITLKKVDTGFYRSWTEGKIVFREERLENIVERLERWYNVEIVLESPETANLRFSGTILKDKPFDQIARAFELLLPVKISYQNNMDKKDVVKILKK